MANNQQSDSNNVNSLAWQLQSTLSEHDTDQTEQDISRLVQNIQLADEKIDSSDELIPDISVQDSFSSAGGTDNAVDFDEPLFWEKHPWLVLFSVILVIGLAVGGFFLYLHFNQTEGNYAATQIPDGIYAAGVQIGGMTESQAVTALERSIPSFAQKSVVISCGEDTLELTPEDIAFSMNIDDAVEAAMQITDASGKRLDMDIQPYVQMNYQRISDQIDVFFTQEDSSFVQSSYRLEGVAPVLSFDRYNPEIPVQTLVLNRGVPGTVRNTDDFFETFVENYLKGNLQIQIEENNTTHFPDELNLESIHRTLSTNPIASHLASDGKTFLPGSLGYTFSLEDAQQALASAEYCDEVSIPMQLIFPNFEGSSLFPDELGSYMLPCDTNELPKVRQACLAINGQIVNQGRKFSMSESLGRISLPDDCRYVPAEDDGVCMTASAIFRAALNSGMWLFTASRHNYLVSYTEPAFDVFFSKNGSDFQFLNFSGSPILVLTAFQPDGIYVKILGTDSRDYAVELNQLTDAAPAYSSTTKNVRHAEGYEQGDIIQNGINGYIGRLEFVKRSKENGTVLSSDIIRNLYYEAVPEIIANVID